MSDFDPPLDRAYDPEYPLESDDDDERDAGDFTATNRSRISNNSQVPQKKSRWSSPEARPAPPELFCMKTYSRNELYPTELDPDCYPPWALSPYWPVYVSNFRLNSLDETERNAQISTYFACKGLLTRMIYIRENDDPFFRNHQSKTLLLDMLVYFTCKADADRAIRCCDRTTYYGHVLNVFPGRVPVYFDPSLTVRFKIPKQYSVEHTETPTERGFKARYGPGIVSTIVKHSECKLLVEFEARYLMNLAVSQCDLWIPSRLTEPVRKQRYLEQDCRYDMMFLLQENPGFIDMLPPENVLQDLLHGRLPPVNKDWDGWAFPKQLPDEIYNSIYRDKIERKERMKEDDSVKWDEVPASLAEEVDRQKEVFFGIIQHQQKPEETSSESSSRKNPQLLHRDVVERKQKDFERKFAMICVPNRNNARNVAQGRRIEEGPSEAISRLMPGYFQQKKFNAKKTEFLTKRKKLLTKEGVVRRNGLFFDLLRLERSLGNMTGKRANLQCDELRTGLIATVHSMGLQKRFSQYYSNFPKNLDLLHIEEPLDMLTPVFLGNFFTIDLSQKSRNQQVKGFFAVRGLSVCMVYLNESDEFYNSYLKQIKLLDMLVYFRTKEEAEKAIKCVHGLTYHGHKLSVLPGRQVKYYEPNRAVFLELDDDPTIAEGMIGQFLGSEALPIEDLNSVMRYPKKVIFLFNKTKQGKAVAQIELSAKLVSKPFPKKQRYLEADVKTDLLRKILRDADFLNEQPQDGTALRSLFAVKSLPPEEDDIGAVVWDGDYQHRKDLNEQVVKVLVEWKKTMKSVAESSKPAGQLM
ncbi:uncharacterized protein LOC5572405 [Aedes aegypti]|uniref:Uncharacterized protein n=1 Tax=Aedes aegypti TaxID=7159 RepID=A0A6I8TI55_AEDAE|nr:uncharacterized protein LOC5572405 [Aedes aegypti]